MVQKSLEKLSNFQDLDEEHAYRLMNAIMDGEATPSQIAGLLVSLRMKGETVDEIAGFVCAMRDKATHISAPADVVDTCGTGGDGRHTFNISTAAAIVAAAAGVSVAKHGNRSVSSACGSADVLQELGVKIDLTPAQSQACLEQVGLAFLFAPVYHASMKHAVLPRKEIGIRTVFNILGPMSNPAEAQRQVIGVFNQSTAQKMARVLQKLGSEHILLVHSQDGLDEISLSSGTLVSELKNGVIHEYQIHPRDLGLEPNGLDRVQGAAADVNAAILRNVLDGGNGASTDVTALNAAAAIYVSGRVQSLQEGLVAARQSLADGRARQKLQDLIAFTQSAGMN